MGLLAFLFGKGGQGSYANFISSLRKSGNGTIVISIGEIIDLNRRLYRDLKDSHKSIADAILFGRGVSLTCATCGAAFSGRYLATLFGGGDPKAGLGKGAVVMWSSAASDEDAARKGICPKCGKDKANMTVKS